MPTGPRHGEACTNTGPTSSYGPGSAPACRAHLRSGAYDTSAIVSPGWLRRRQQRSGLPPPSSVTSRSARPALSRTRSAAATSASIASTLTLVRIVTAVSMTFMLSDGNVRRWPESAVRLTASIPAGVKRVSRTHMSGFGVAIEAVA